MIKLFRINEWLLNKLTFNLAIGLCVLYYCDAEISDIFKAILFICTYIISIGAFGYFINDVFDTRIDKQVNKLNQTDSISVSFKIIIIGLLILLAIIPFVILSDKPETYLLLLTIHVFLLFTYSVPFIKVKTRIIGIIWDSLYSYVMPALITVEISRQCSAYITFREIQWILPVIWLFMIGIRSIINHQLADYQNDINSGVRTFVATYGKKTGYTISYICTLIELIIFITFILLSDNFIRIAFAAAVFLFVIIEIGFKNKTFKSPSLYGKVLVFLNHFYDYYLLMGMLLWLAFIWHPAYLLIVIVFVFFRLNVFSLLYYHVILWMYYKCLGVFRKIKKIILKK